MNNINYVYSPSQNLSYPISLKNDYEHTDSWPSDGVDITDVIRHEFFDNPPPKGKIRAAGKDGLPVWVDIPPLSKGELITIAKNEKAERLSQADSIIEILKDAVEFKMATEDEVKRYNEWRKYRVLLSRIDVEKAPDIDWPEKPNE